jgi:hypothetical protein
MRPRIVLAISLAMVTAARADPKAEGFRKLNGAEIKRAFSGHTFSDEVHFSFRYLAGGVIEGAGMGKKVSRTWRVEKDALCITDTFGENCYAIWKKGPAVKFVTSDDAVVFAEGVLK